MQKISSSHLFILEIQSILETYDQTGHTHFWQYPKCFDQLLIYVDLYENAKLAISLICTAKYILPHISGTKFFPNMGFVRKNNEYQFSL